MCEYCPFSLGAFYGLDNLRGWPKIKGKFIIDGNVIMSIVSFSQSYFDCISLKININFLINTLYSNYSIALGLPYLRSTSF